MCASNLAHSPRDPSLIVQLASVSLSAQLDTLRILGTGNVNRTAPTYLLTPRLSPEPVSAIVQRTYTRISFHSSVSALVPLTIINTRPLDNV